jgi:tripartite-type tricarboxylate transporter receptor subunit TctC
MPYDIFKDLVTLSVVSSSPEVLVVAPQLGIKTYAELVAYGKANPGKLNYASAGVGTTPHLAAEMWKLRTGIDAVHVPYKGIGGSFTDMMSNKVQMAFSSIAGALPFTSDNRIVPLATTGTTRSAVYPDLPTVAEAGLPGYSVRHAARRAGQAQQRHQQGVAGWRAQSVVRQVRLDAARH